MPGFRPRRDPLLRLASSANRRAAVGTGSVGVAGVRRAADVSGLGGGANSITGELHKIDEFTVTDDTDDAFTLSHVPVSGSWNVSMGRVLSEARYTIAGKTLTVTDPTDTFKRIADQDPRTLRVQYDYLVGMPDLGIEPAEFPQTATAGNQSSPSTITFAGNPAAGASVLLTVSSRFAGTQTPTGLGATWTQIASVAGGTGSIDTRPTQLWVGVGCDGASGNVTMTGDESARSAMVEVSVALTASGAVTDTTVGDAVGTAATVGPVVATGPGLGVTVIEKASGSFGTVTDTPASGWTTVRGDNLRFLVAPLIGGETIQLDATSGFNHGIAAEVRYA